MYCILNILLEIKVEEPIKVFIWLIKLKGSSGK